MPRQRKSKTVLVARRGRIVAIPRHIYEHNRKMRRKWKAEREALKVKEKESRNGE